MGTLQFPCPKWVGFSSKKNYLWQIWKLEKKFSISLLGPFSPEPPLQGTTVTACMGALFPVIELNNAICFSAPSRVSEFQMPPPPLVWLVPSIYVRVWSLAYSFATNFNYVITMSQLHPSHQIFWGKQISKLPFQVYSERQIFNPSGALSWIWGPILSFTFSFNT